MKKIIELIATTIDKGGKLLKATGIKDNKAAYIEFSDNAITIRNCSFSDSEFLELITYLQSIAAKLNHIIGVTLDNNTKISSLPDFSFLPRLNFLKISSCHKIKQLPDLTAYGSLVTLEYKPVTMLPEFTLPALPASLVNLLIPQYQMNLDVITKVLAHPNVARIIISNPEFFAAILNLENVELFTSLLNKNLFPDQHNFTEVNAFIDRLCIRGNHPLMQTAINDQNFMAFLCASVKRRTPYIRMCQLSLNILQQIFTNDQFMLAIQNRAHLFHGLLLQHKISTLMPHLWFKNLLSLHSDKAIADAIKLNSVSKEDLELLIADRGYINSFCNKLSLLEHTSSAKRLYLIQKIFAEKKTNLAKCLTICRIAAHNLDIPVLQFMFARPELKDNSDHTQQVMVDCWKQIAQANDYALRGSSIAQTRSLSDLRSMKRDFLLQTITHPAIYEYADDNFETTNLFLRLCIDKFVPDLFRMIENASKAAQPFVFETSQHAALTRLILRTLIKENTLDARNMLQKLLEVPQISALAVLRNNELLKTASMVGNIEASEMLLKIPAVLAEAERNNYYADESLDNTNIADIVADNESATRSLTATEKLAYECVINRYGAQMQQQGGYLKVFEAFKQYITEQYNKNPAEITINNTAYVLPLDVTSVLPSLIAKVGPAFQGNPNTPAFTAAQEDAAKIAYITNPYHTLLRYFSIPNPLMHHKAANIIHRYKPNDKEPEHYRKALEQLAVPANGMHTAAQLVTAIKAGTANNPEIAYAWFDGHIEKIAYLWLAASDVMEPERNGFNTQKRIDFFINEFVQLGRTHNSDKKRIRNGKEEEYDDLEYDIPSCYVGVPKRLAQAVREHSAFTMPTVTELKYHAIELTRDYFSKLFADMQPAALAALRDKINEFFFSLNFNKVDALIIPNHLIQSLIKKVQDNAPATFAPFIKVHIEKTFKLVLHDNHLFQFYQEGALDKILDAQYERNNEEALDADILDLLGFDPEPISPPPEDSTRQTMLVFSATAIDHADTTRKRAASPTLADHKRVKPGSP